jgi:predicted P-loop ATPase
VKPDTLITGTTEIGAAIFSTGITNPEFTRVAQSFLAGQPASKKDVLNIIMNLPNFQNGMFMGLVQDLKQLVVGKSMESLEPVQSVSPGSTSTEKPENFESLKMLFESRPPITPRLSLKSAIVQVSLADADTFRRVAGYLDKVDQNYRIVGQVGSVLEVSCSVVGNLETVTQKLIEAVNKAYQPSFAVDKLSDVYRFIPVEIPVPEPVEAPRRVDAEGFPVAETPVLLIDPGSPA